MTAHRAIPFLVAATLAGCAATTPGGAAQRAKGTQDWSWRMSRAARPEAARPEAARAEVAPEPEAGPVVAKKKAPAIDPWAWRLGKRSVAARPVAAARPAPRAERLRVASAPRKQASPKLDGNDQEFLDKILDENADAEDGEITMSAMELPKAAKKKVEEPAKKIKRAPVEDEVVMSFDPEVAPEPKAKAPEPNAKKKRMTRAEKRRARALAKAEAKKAKLIAAREARLRGKRGKLLEKEKPHQAIAARKNRKKKVRAEGFIEDDEKADADAEDDEEEVASSDDEEEAEEEAEEPQPKKKPAAKIVASKATKPAPAVKLKKEKTDWSGQVIDDEDPLKKKK